MRTKHLSELLSQLPEPTALPTHDPLITGIVWDSRQVKPGNLFVALSGGNTDGHLYIGDAIRSGAVAIAGSQPQIETSVPYIQLAADRRALAYLSAAFYDFPGRDLVLVGVTGTDGKTTTTSLIYNIMRTAGIQAGMISTVNAVIGEQVLDTGFHVTTPEAPDVQRYLDMMRSAGITHVVLEVTSHGLAQERVAACDFDIGVVTNITHEHLDFHGNYENYRAAKARLFQYLAHKTPKKASISSLAVLNYDDQSYEDLKNQVQVPVLSYGLASPADLTARDIELSPKGMSFIADGKLPGGSSLKVRVDSRLVGQFNVSNCLAAIGATVFGLAIEPSLAEKGISALPGIPGRMERIDLGQPFVAIVDFAHTPNALQQAVEAARLLTPGKVITVFGSAGLRDREKRWLMAQKSVEYADLSILTAEDPRTEALQDILEQMAQGALSRGGVEGQTFWRIPDRREAIRFGVRLARPGDILLVCGKGHEQSMCFGEVEYAWDDRIALRAALAELLGLAGPPMPELPESL